MVAREKFQPMLSGKFDLNDPAIFAGQLKKLSYPMICSPKVDGIRVICDKDEGAVTRKIKAVPNHHVRESLNLLRDFNIDGEVVVGAHHTIGDGTDVFNRTTCIMARDGKPDFHYWVFDMFECPDNPYWERHQALCQLMEHEFSIYPWIHLLESRQLETAEEVLEYEAECIERGFEGLMLRSQFGRYKFGRSTLREQHLIKLKRVETFDAEIIGYEQKRTNQNEQEKDAFGYAKRSSHKENRIPVDMLGTWICKSEDFKETFKVGCGWDHAQASLWWKDPEAMIGRVIELKYQRCGTIDRPRHPIYLRTRND